MESAHRPAAPLPHPHYYGFFLFPFALFLPVLGTRDVPSHHDSRSGSTLLYLCRHLVPTFRRTEWPSRRLGRPAPLTLPSNQKVSWAFPSQVWQTLFEPRGGFLRTTSAQILYSLVTSCPAMPARLN